MGKFRVLHWCASLVKAGSGCLGTLVLLGNVMAALINIQAEMPSLVRLLAHLFGR